jgi:hypothetical protein
MRLLTFGQKIAIAGFIRGPRTDAKRSCGAHLRINLRLVNLVRSHA